MTDKFQPGQKAIANFADGSSCPVEIVRGRVGGEYMVKPDVTIPKWVNSSELTRDISGNVFFTHDRHRIPVRVRSKYDNSDSGTSTREIEPWLNGGFVAEEQLTPIKK